MITLLRPGRSSRSSSSSTSPRPSESTTSSSTKIDVGVVGDDDRRASSALGRLDATRGSRPRRAVRAVAVRTRRVSSTTSTVERRQALRRRRLRLVGRRDDLRVATGAGREWRCRGQSRCRPRNPPPPACVTMPCTIARPRPVPLPVTFVVKNGSKMRGWVSRSMPRRCRSPQSDVRPGELAVGPARSASSSTTTQSSGRRPRSSHRVVHRQVVRHRSRRSGDRNIAAPPRAASRATDVRPTSGAAATSSMMSWSSTERGADDVYDVSR